MRAELTMPTVAALVIFVGACSTNATPPLPPPPQAQGVTVLCDTGTGSEPGTITVSAAGQANSVGVNQDSSQADVCLAVNTAATSLGLSTNYGDTSQTIGNIYACKHCNVTVVASNARIEVQPYYSILRKR